MFHFECNEEVTAYLNPLRHAWLTVLVVVVLTVLQKLRGPVLEYKWHLKISLVYSALTFFSLFCAAMENAGRMIPVFSWLLSFINIAFLSRNFFQETEHMEKVVETWMFLHNIREWHMNMILSGYRFLIVGRLLYRHMMGFAFVCVGKRLFQLVKVTLLTLVCLMLLAGALYAVEDEGERCTITNEKYPFLTYVYMVGVTLSTVGYGEFRPVVTVTKAMICVAILVGTPLLMFYLMLIRFRLKEVLQAAVIPSLDDRPRLVLLCSEGYDVQKLKTHFGHLVPTVDVVIIVDTIKQTHGNWHNRKFPVVSAPVSSYLLRQLFMGRKPQSTKIILLNDKETDAPSADRKVIRFVTMALNGAMGVGIVAQVRLPQSRIYLENMQSWDRSRNTVVCMEEITMGLMAKTMVAPGAGSMFCNMLYPEHYKAVTTSDFCAQFMLDEYLDGENFKIFSTAEIFLKEEPFAEAAIKYAQNEAVLIGCWNNKGLWLLPRVLPKDTHRLYISHPDNVSDWQSRSIISYSGSVSQSKEFYAIRDQVAVKVKDSDPCLLTEYLRRYPQIVSCDDDSAYTIACVPYDPKTVGSLYKKSAQARIVSNRRHRARSLVDDKLNSPFWHDTFINEDVLLYALLNAYQKPDLYRVWAELVESPNIVEVDVKDNCCAFVLLKELLKQDLMLLGVNVQLTRLCTKCQDTYSLPVDHPVWLPITSPSQEFILAPGDKAIALRIGLHPQLESPFTPSPNLSVQQDNNRHRSDPRYDISPRSLRNMDHASTDKMSSAQPYANTYNAHILPAYLRKKRT